MSFITSALWVLAVPALLAFIVYLVVQAAQKKFTVVRTAIVGFVMVSAFVTGAISLLLLPDKVLNIKSEPIVFGVRVAFGVAIILIGLLLKNKLQKYFLLILGMVMLIAQAPYVINNYGSYGALIIVGLAFIALIVATILLTRKHGHEQVS